MRIIGFSAVFLAGALMLAPSAWAQEAAEADPCAEGPSGAWERSTALGDFGGHRNALCRNGITLGATQIGEYLTNPVGGLQRGGKYQGRLEMALDADFSMMVGIPGLTGRASAFWLQGGRLSEKDIGNLMPVSSIEAVPGLRLFTLWLQQNLWDDFVSLRVGQLAADDEFYVSTVGLTFINTTFGWPTQMSANLPSGGPAFPFAGPGARLKLSFNEQWSWMTGVFTVDPAGRPNGQPAQWRNHDGTAFSFYPGTFTKTEAAYAVNQGKQDEGLAATYKLGGWYTSNRYNDMRWDSRGVSLADSSSSGTGKPIRGNWGLYGVVDQMLIRTEAGSDRGLWAFMRGGGSPSDRNTISWNVQGGLSLKGPFDDRPDDIVGIAYSHSAVSDRLQALDRDNRRVNNLPTRPVREYEGVVETTYLAAVTPWWSVQPNAQYVINPGGGIPNPRLGNNLKQVEDAVVLGVRTTMKF